MLWKASPATASPSFWAATSSGPPRSRTAAWCAAAKNPRGDVIGHLGDPRFSVDYEAVIRAFREGGQAVELNSTAASRKAAAERNRRRKFIDAVLSFCLILLDIRIAHLQKSVKPDAAEADALLPACRQKVVQC